MPPIDLAILKALSLDEKNTTLISHGGSSFTGTFKLSTKDNNRKEKAYFAKIGKGEESGVMFAGMFFSFWWCLVGIIGYSHLFAVMYLHSLTCTFTCFHLLSPAFTFSYYPLTSLNTKKHISKYHKTNKRLTTK
jgi:hypothetical protein